MNATVQWILGLALVVLPAATVVLSIAPWYERATLATVAAQEAVRAAALADDWQDAQHVVATIEERFAGNGRSRMRLTLSSTSGGLTRDAVLRVAADVRMPGAVIPFLGEVGAFTHTVTHGERVDPYRSFP